MQTSRCGAKATFAFRFSVVISQCLICGVMASPSASFAADARKIVIPFDFVSKFDDGRYGQMVGDMIWKKLSGDKRLHRARVDARRSRLLRKPQAAAVARDGPR